MELEPHTPNRFNTSTLSIHYNPSEPLTKSYKQLMSIFCTNNRFYLNHLREFIKGSLTIERSCQTILLISGRPGSGKSTFISFLASIFRNLLLAFDVRGKNQFDRFSWLGKRVLVLNDVTQIDASLAEILKQLSGRDRIKYDVKSNQNSSIKALSLRAF